MTLLRFQTRRYRYKLMAWRKSAWHRRWLDWGIYEPHEQRYREFRDWFQSIAVGHLELQRFPRR